LIGVILAAGRGQRLGRDVDLEKIGPKCLLTINGCTLLERMIADLASFNVDTINIAVGYKADAVQEVRVALEKKYNVDLHLAYNHDYLSTNTAYSLDIGLNDVHDDVVIFNGDMLYDYTILSNLLSITQTAIAVDDKKKLTGESFKLRIVNGRIKEMGKSVPIEEATGEFIGISKIVRRDVEEAKRLLEVQIADDLNNYYDFIYQAISQNGNLVYSFTNGLKWTEIDDIYDLKYAKSIADASDSTRGHLR
jgi:choline kinase